MKRKIIVLTFILGFMAFVTGDLQAQTDAYFSVTKEIRSHDAVGTGFGFDEFSEQSEYGFGFGNFYDNLNGLGFDGFGGDGGLGFDDFGNDGGLGFGSFDFVGEDGEVPLGSGTLFLCSLAAAYLVKKRVRNKCSFGR